MGSFNEEFDLVVVGSGGGSMCAALLLHTVGKKTVILEKTDKAGGTTSMSGGVMWIPNNCFMADAGLKDSPDQAMRYLDSVVGDRDDAPGATQERRKTYVREAPNMIDFLVSQGIELLRAPCWPDYYDERPGGSVPGRTVIAKLFDVNELGEWRSKLRRSFLHVAPLYSHEGIQLVTMKHTWTGRIVLLRLLARMLNAKLSGKQLVSSGTALQGRMLKAALAAEIDIRLGSPVSKLLTEGGRVVGVLTVKDGKEWRIGARLGVLLNAGGFARNQKMREQYMPGTSAKWTNVSPGDTGEMIEEGIRIGAAVAQMEEMVGQQVTLPPDNKTEFNSMIQMEISKPHAILVDQTGVRFMNEAGSYMEAAQNILRRNKLAPAVPSWMIIDDQFFQRYMLSGTLPGAARRKAWLKDGFLKKGETLRELAIACGIDPKTLQVTVTRYNGFVDKGRDEDFNRGARAYDRWLGDATHRSHATLGTIEKGPFYAVPVYPGDVGTYGGLVTDAHARVLREDGSAIPGLYATGTSTASVMGRTYPGAGCSVGPSFTWGYVAAKHAAGLAEAASEEKVAPLKRAAR
jgi:3-oxosteroid 1-dehydrogenase